MPVDTCRKMLYKASSMIDNDRPEAEIHRVFESIRDMVMNGTARLTNDEYYWFCSKYSENCYYLGKYQEAEYFLKRAIDFSLNLQDYDDLAYSVSKLMMVMVIGKRYSEAIAIGEKYETICYESDWVYEIETGLCLVYSVRGWNRKAQRLADKVIDHKRKNPDAYYQPITCDLYKRSYNFGRCRDRIGLLHEWYDLESHVNGGNSVTAMEVFAEMVMVMVQEDMLREIVAIRTMEEMFPVLANSKFEHSLNNLQCLYAFQADLYKSIGARKEALEYYAKAKAILSDANENDREFLLHINEEIAEIETSRSAEKH